MGLQDTRLMQWAAQQFYSAGAGAHRTGSVPTKLEPSAGQFAEGYANDIPIGAQQMNWLQAQYDAMRNGLVLDRMTQFGRQINIGVGKLPGAYSNAALWEVQNSAAVSPGQNDIPAGVFSTRLRRFVNHQSSNVTTYRDALGGIIASVGLTVPTMNATRGGYVRGPALASSYACFLDVGVSNRVAAMADSGVNAVATTATGGHTALDCEPLVTEGTTPTNGKLQFLSFSGGVIFFNTWTPAVGTGALPAPVSTGLTGQLSAMLHRLPSGRIWITTSTRAAYSDNDGATWTFDGAVQPAVGIYCTYDRENARWIRWSGGGSSLVVQVAANPNNPTAVTTLKTIADVAMLARPARFGRFVFAVLQFNGLEIRPCVSADYGLTWAPGTEMLRNMHTDEGQLASPFTGYADLMINAYAWGVVVGARSASRGWRMLPILPIVDPDAAGLIT